MMATKTKPIFVFKHVGFFLFGLTLVAPSSLAKPVFCTNCADRLQAEMIINELKKANVGIDDIIKAIQAASAQNSKSVEESARMIAEANALAMQDKAIFDAEEKYRPVDPCSSTAMTNSSTAVGDDSAFRNSGSPTVTYTGRGGGGRGGGGGGWGGGGGRGGGGGGGGGAIGSSGDKIGAAISIHEGRSAAPTPEIQAAIAAGGACEKFAASTGRERLCRKAGFSTAGSGSAYPDADVRAETLFYGPQRKLNELRRIYTYKGNSEEENVMAAFMRNIHTPIEFRELGAGELRTDAGRKFMAIRDSYMASMNLAMRPAYDMAIMKRANPRTKSIIKQLLGSDDADFVRNYLSKAYQFYEQDGISIAELIKLEGERRYKNPNWHTRMAEATGDALLREIAQLQAAQIWMMSMLLEHVHQLAVVQGLGAAATLRMEKMPLLAAAHRAAQR